MSSVMKVSLSDDRTEACFKRLGLQCI